MSADAFLPLAGERASVQGRVVCVDGDERLAVRAARQADGVIAGGPTIRVGNARYPARPTCQILEYADHGVTIRLRYWLRTPYYAGKVRSEIQERIWEELETADVEFPYPHTHVVFDETSGAARVIRRVSRI